MKNIDISDITLRKMAEDGKTPVSFNEKTVIAKELDKLNVSVIETAPILNGKKDVLFLHTIASLVKNSVISCPTALSEDSVKETYDALKGAVKPRLLIPVPVSIVQMEYMCKLKPAKVLELIKKLVTLASSLCEDVEVEMLDATRAEKEFLKNAIATAVTAGAKTVTVSDTAGDMLPEEMAGFIKGLKSDVPELENAVLSVVCNDKLGMAVAVATAAIMSGADQIKTVVSGDGVPTTRAIANVIRERGESLGVKSDINMTKVEHAIAKMSFITESKASAITPFDAGTGADPTDDIVLDENSAVGDISEALSKIGYELSDDDIKNVYETVKKTAAKKSVGNKELDSIVASVAMQVPSVYKLKSYVINSGDVITPTANIEIVRGEETLRGFCIGDGPIDAAFLAIEKITGHHYELDDFQIQSVTRGYEAMGSTLVKLRHNGKIFSGTGTSTDIVGASISAYINALNKISFEEGLA
ncbi:MAG: hypothetical protein IJ391_06235 [Clostridia bacterium]|nr:hypothetical protein [Clostridia bacterium]